MRFGCWVCIATLAVCGCSGAASPGPEANAAGTIPCRPLDPVTTEVSLDATAIVAAGRSEDGTLYVLSEVASRLTLFVALGDTLIDQPAAGTGEQADGDAQTYLFDYQDEAGDPVSVQVKRDGSGWRMGVLRGSRTEKVWDLDTEGELLVSVDARSAAQLRATSTQTWSLDYVGAQFNGDLVVVIRPDRAQSFDEYRLFWGAPVALSEQKIQSFSRGLSLGGTTSVAFAVQGGTGELDYSFPYPQMAGDKSLGSLVISKARQEDGESLDGAFPPALPDGAQFFCR